MSTDIIKAELDRITDESGGILEARVVLESARANDSPLHSYFDWNDGEAAEKFRLLQAGNLIRRVKIIIDKSPDKVMKLRAYAHLPADRRGYRSSEKALEDEAMRSEMLRAALRDLQSLRERYSKLTELATMFAELDKVAAQVAVSVKSA